VLKIANIFTRDADTKGTSKTLKPYHLLQPS